MRIEFTTCERRRALMFIQSVYPDHTLIDEPGSKISQILDIVEQDIIRIQDPAMYGSRIAVIPGENWDVRDLDKTIAIKLMLSELHEELNASSDHDAAELSGNPG